MPGTKGAKSDATDDDIKLPDPKEGDIIIPIMGVTGVGKSTFINAAAKVVATSVGHDLESGTKEIQPVIIPYPDDNNRRLIFVDTPGFNNPSLDDAEIWRRITIWLDYSCTAGVKLGGIIYLHEISQTRIQTTGSDLATFSNLSRRSAAHNVVLATTKWTQPVGDEARKREEQLCKQYWMGLDIPRFVNTHKSAWDIIELILRKTPLDTPEFRALLDSLPQNLPKAKPKTAWAVFAGLFGKLLG